MSVLKLKRTPIGRGGKIPWQVNARQFQLEKDLAAASKALAATTLLPKIAETYCDRIRAQIAGLTEPEAEDEGREAIRGLIDRIVDTPVPMDGKRCGRR